MDGQSPSTSTETLTITKVSPHIGAEISNIDLTRPLSDSQIQQLRQAFIDHQVIFFRDQKISFDDHARLGQYFGPLGMHVGKATISKPTDNPYVRRFHADENSTRVSGENFHSDQSCAEVPPLASVLNIQVCPPDGGGDTMFASMYAAYDALSDRMKSYLDGLTATHDGTRVFGEGSPVSSHPVVITHPESGRKALYVNVDFTSKINELPALEGKRLLEFLIEHSVRAEWTCRFRWTPHSIAMWDNRCTMHKAVFDYWPNTRTGYRVQIEGTAKPVA